MDERVFSMMPADTTRDAERVQLQLLREMGPTERLALVVRLSSDVIRAGKRAIARVNPNSTEEQIGRHFIALHYGQVIANGVRGTRRDSRMAETSELVQALRPVVDELNRLGVRYYVGGSVASAIHGAARSTLDVDVVATLDQTTALRLIAVLHDDYYVSEATVLDAVQRRACFNLIHLATSFKVDVFVSRDRNFDRSVQDRAVTEVFGETGLSTCIATAEDVILLKLEWYRLGNETSERQWNDVSAVASLQGDRLDRAYLRRWAHELGVTDLLDRLLSEVEKRKLSSQ